MSKSVADLDMPAKIQFMLTLVKLWKNFQYEDISVRFACQQQKHASQIFKTWIHIIHSKFLEIRDQLFIRHDDLNPPLPAEWTNNPYTSVQGRCLIDTLEFKFESAKNNQFKTRCGQFRVFFPFWIAYFSLNLSNNGHGTSAKLALIFIFPEIVTCLN